MAENNGERNIGHYFDSLAKAREDFAKRSGLVDCNKLFDETELELIREGLAQCLYDSDCDIGNLQEIHALINKIDEVITPAISRESEAVDDYENEWEY